MEIFSKGSEQWQFIGDYWTYRKEYGNPDMKDPDGWFERMVAAGHALRDKYKGTTVEQFASDLILAHWNDVERRYMEQRR